MDTFETITATLDDIDNIGEKFGALHSIAVGLGLSLLMVSFVIGYYIDLKIEDEKKEIYDIMRNELSLTDREKEEIKQKNRTRTVNKIFTQKKITT